ncbi:MAG: endolytic transglycosylase MltG [Bryobacteraceae bacterium]
MRFLRVLLVLLLLAAIGGGYVLFFLSRPYRHFETRAFIDFPKGTSTEEMAALLNGAGVVRHSWMFLLARALSPGSKLQAGEYEFTKPASTFQVFKRIARGDIFYYELLVPEGNNIFDISSSVDRLGIFSGQEFLKVARNPRMIRDLDPLAPTLEGYLFPNTYRLSRHTSAEQLCRLMTNKFRETWKELKTAANVHNTVTLASLVEKEARLPQERPIIASAFRNRLKIGMKLDCDPTTVYAALLEGRYRGTIYRSDLESASPYNTYTRAGLPPGPIANPSRSSLKAVLEPADTNYLYFVAKGDGSGGHRFSDNLAAHNAATAEFRRAAN